MSANPGETLNCHPMSVRIGFGASGLGNLYREIPEAVADSALTEAYTEGIRYFDTSPFYGFGLSELRVGRFLRSLDRGSFLLSSKVGRYMVPPRGQPVDKLYWAAPLGFKPVFDYSYEGVLHSIEQSVIRLGFERIDILFIHDVDHWTHGSAFPKVFAIAMQGAYRALDELRRAGHVKAIGVGINEQDVAADFVRAGEFDCVMLAGRYTQLDQRALDDFLPLALSRGVDVFVAGVFNSGILAQTPPYHRPTYDYADASPEIVQRATRIAEICAAHGVPVQAAAVKFPLGHPAVKTVVLGMSNPAHVRQTLAWFGVEVPVALWEQLKDEGLLRRDAPIPSQAAPQTGEAYPAV
jgi:D-threo-aldose 1-dehydrogenase